MADKKLSLQHQEQIYIEQYRKLQPKTKLTDKQIAELFHASKKTNADKMKGTMLERNSAKERTITLKSGKTITVESGVKSVKTEDGIVNIRPSGRYSVTAKDGKIRYYAADGTELNERYFKLVEEKKAVIVKSSDGKKYNLNGTLEKRLNNVSKNLKKAEDENGFIGKAWSGFKNLTGIGASSDKVREQQEQEKKLLVQFNNSNNNWQKQANIFEKMTGVKSKNKEEFDQNNLKFIKGEIKLKSEQKFDGYKEGQTIAVDITSDIVSGIAAVGIYTAAVAAAPFTGGASIAVGVAAAAASGAVIKTGLKVADAASGGRKYDSLSHDLLMGSVNGAIAPLTAGAGGAVCKAIGARLGLQVVKEGGKAIAKEGAKQVVSQATKQAAKQGLKRTFKSAAIEGLKNPMGYKLVADGVKNGTIKKAAAFMAEGAVDGGLSGGIYSGVETAHNGGSAGEILQATVIGTVMGAGMGGVMNTGMKQGLPAIGKMFKGKSKAGEETLAPLGRGQGRGAGTEAAHDAVETSVVRNADEVVPAPKSQGVREAAQDAAPAPRTETPEAIHLQRELSIAEKTQKFKEEILTHKTLDSGETIPRFTPEQVENIVKLYQSDEEFIGKLLYQKNEFFLDTYEYTYDDLVKFAEFHKSNREITECILNLDNNSYYTTKLIESVRKHFDNYTEKEMIEILEHFEECIGGQNIDNIIKALDDPNLFAILTYQVADCNGNKNYLVREGLLLWDIGEEGVQKLKQAIDNGQISKLAKELEFGNGGGLYCTLEHISDDEYQMCIHNAGLYNDINEIQYQIQYSMRKIKFKLDENGNVHNLGRILRDGDNGYVTVYPDGSKMIEKNIPTENELITKELYSSDRKLIRRDEIRKSDLRRGESEITVTRPDAEGNLVTEQVGTVKIHEIIDENGNHQVARARKRVESPDGSVSRQIKVFGERRHGTRYKIIDKDGNVQFDTKRSHIKLDENHYRTAHNGERFDIKFENDGITVSIIDKDGKLTRPVKISANELDPELMDLYKQLPGDYLYKLKLMGVKVKYEPITEIRGKMVDRSCYRPSEKTIIISERSKNNPEVFAHEYAHAIDDYLGISSLANGKADSEYLRLSQQDWEAFSKSSGVQERESVSYFTQNLDPTDYNPDVELIAGVEQVIAGFSDAENFHQIGDAILFQNYARTIAYVGKKLDMPIEEFARAGRNSSDLGMAAIPPTAPRKAAPAPTPQTQHGTPKPQGVREVAQDAILPQKMNLKKNEPVTVEKAKEMLLNLGFPKHEIDAIEFGNNELENITYINFLIKEKLVPGFEEVNFSSSDAAEIRKSIYSAIKEEPDNVARLMNKENLDEIKKYLQLDNLEDARVVADTLDDFSEHYDDIMRIIPILTENGKVKMSLQKFKELKLIDPECFPFITKERVAFVDKINSQVPDEYKIPINAFKDLGNADELTDELATEYVNELNRFLEHNVINNGVSLTDPNLKNRIVQMRKMTDFLLFLGEKEDVINISAAQQKMFVENILANNNPNTEHVLKNFNFEQYGKQGLPLKYSREDFTANVEKLINNLSPEEQQIILEHFGLIRGAAGFDGLPTNKPFNNENVSAQLKEIAQKVQDEIEAFTVKNEIHTGDVEVDNVLNGLIKGLPEFTSIVGKEQYGIHEYSVDIHSLKVLQSAMNNPLYAKLSDVDKTILKIAAFCHDLGKRGNVADEGHAKLSAKYVRVILDKFPLPRVIKDRIMDIVDNHHWFEAYNTGTVTAEDVAVRCRRPGDFVIYEILAKADFENVSKDFHISRSNGVSSQAEFDKYMLDKMKAIDEVLTRMYSKANLVFDTQFTQNGKKFPRYIIEIEGAPTELRVLNLNDLEWHDSLQQYGFAPGVTKENARFIIHMTEPGVANMESVMLLTENSLSNTPWSTSLIKPSNNRTYDNRRFGFIFDVDLSNISEANCTNTNSGYRKTLDTFKKILFDADGSERTFVKDHLMSELSNIGIELSDKEYAQLFRFLVTKKYITQIKKDIKIGNKIIKASDLVACLEKSRDALFEAGNIHNEIVSINPRVKGLIAKVEKLEDCPPGFLKFAKLHNLPIILMKESTNF